jgi:uncharacterized protein
MNELPAGPIRPGERIELLDVIRGVALLGILQVNFIYFQGGVVGGMQSFFLDGKMRTIYSFLFGLGFALQLISAEEKQRPFVARYLWRTFILFCIGTAHFILIWSGDIIRDYALMALVLLVVQRARPWMLLVLAAAALTFSLCEIENLPGRGSEPYLRRVDPEQSELVRQEGQTRNERRQRNRDAREHAEQDGGYFAGVRAGAMLRLEELRNTEIGTFIGGDLLTLFLLGFYAGRRGIFRDPGRHRRLFWWILGVGLLVGYSGAFYSVLGDFAQRHNLPLIPENWNWGVTYYIGNDCVALAYMSALALLYTSRERVRRWMAVIAPVGRMGLTNYLVQSLIMTTLLYGRGFGLGPAYTWWGVLMLESVYVAQILYSHWWFRRFQFGPVEWAWRS